MKFNERELAVWASTLVPDKEGLLEKRGAGISHGKTTLLNCIVELLIHVWLAR